MSVRILFVTMLSLLFFAPVYADDAKEDCLVLQLGNNAGLMYFKKNKN